MMTRAELAGLVSERNIAAFLRVIREGESSQGPEAYSMRYPGKRFDDLSKHPRILEPTPAGQQSSAAGAYQFTMTTWDRVGAKYGLPDDMSQQSQDEHAVALLADVGVLQPIVEGDLAGAIRKAGSQWASLPGSSLDDGHDFRIADERAVRTFTKYGGVLETQEPAPIEDRSTIYIPPVTAQEKAMDPISLIGMLASVFSPLIRAKVEKAVGTDVGKPLVDNLLGMATQLTGKQDPLEAVAVARQDMAMVKALEKTADEWFTAMGPALDKLAQYDREAWEAEDASRTAAGERGRADAVDIAPMLARSAIILVGSVLFLLCAVMGIQVWFSPSHEPGIAMLTLIGPLLGTAFGVLATVYAYRFGSSRASGAKDVVIGELARRKV